MARDDELGVPAEELVAGASFSPAAGVPIVSIPVIVAEVEVEQHVVDEVVDVEQFADPGVACGRGDSGIGDAHHPVPVRQVAVDRGGDILNIVILSFPISVGCHERSRGSLVEIVEAPVEAVDVEMHETSMGRGLAHGELRVADELVPQVLGPGVLVPMPVGPRVIEKGAQDDRVELIGRVRALGLGFKEGVAQLARSVVTFEQQPEGMLREIWRAAGASLDPDSAVDLEALLFTLGVK